MRRTIAAFIAGIVLGGTGIAVAGSQYAWREHGNTYACRGYEGAAWCKETNWAGSKYEISIIPSWVSITYGGKLVFGCERKYGPRGNCTYHWPG